MKRTVSVEDAVQKQTPFVKIKVICGDGTVTAYDVEHDDDPRSLDTIAKDAGTAVTVWLERHFASPSHEWCNKRRAHIKYLANGKTEPCFCDWMAPHGE